MRLQLHWQAILEDGGMLDETQEGVRYGDLFEKDLRLSSFRLIDTFPWKTPDGSVLPPRLFMSIHLGDGKRLIYRKRTAIEVSMSGVGMDETGRSRVIIAGWQKTLTRNGEPVNTQCLMLIHEASGSVEVMDRFRKGEGIEVRPWEREAGMVEAGLVDPPKGDGGESG